MRFKKYLNENIKTNEPIFDIIRRDCQPFLKELKKTERFLYSGRNQDDRYLNFKIRKNRYPRDTASEIHELFDEHFKKKFGIKLRSESMFVSGDTKQADAYGYIYYVFPKGKYGLYYNTRIHDLWTGLQGAIKQEKTEMHPSLIYNLKYDMHTDQLVTFSEWDAPNSKDEYDGFTNVKEWYSHFIGKIVNKYKKGDLKGAIIFKGEVMLVCDSVYLLRESEFDKKELLNI